MKTSLADWNDFYRFVLSDGSLSLVAQRILLGLILFVCLTVRLLTIGAPLLDRTAWKEIDYVAISNNYWRRGFRFLQPELTWPADPQRVTEMELPIVPYVTAILYQVIGFNVYSARLITLLSFLLLTFYVFRLAKRELGPLVGLVAAFASSVMPLYHPFGRFLLSEPLLIAASTVSVFHFAQWVDSQRQRDWILAMVGFSLAVSLKITALYILVPLFWIAFRRYGWQVKGYQGFLILVLIGLIMPLVWYGYARYLEGKSIHQVGIFRGHNRFQALTMLSDLNWYRTIAWRIIFQILGGWIGTALCLIGLLAAVWLRRGGLFFAYLLAIGIFFVIVAEGQIDAPYRQLTIVPPLSLFVAMGATSVVATGIVLTVATREALISQRLRANICLLGCFLLASVIPSLRYREILRWVDPSLPAVHPDRWEFSQQIKSHIGPDAKLVVVGEYSVHVGGNDLSPVLFHYLGIQGWNLQSQAWNFGTIEMLIRTGATHFAAVPIYSELVPGPVPDEKARMQFVDEMKTRYLVLHENGDWLLLDLRQPIED